MEFPAENNENCNARPRLIQNLDSCFEVESSCVELIFEFLDCQGFENTKEAFKLEAANAGFPLLKIRRFEKDRIKRSSALKLFNGIESSECPAFFKDWDEMVPANIKAQTAYKKLTIYLYTYFSTHSTGDAQTQNYVTNDNTPTDSERKGLGKYSAILDQKGSMSENEEKDQPEDSTVSAGQDQGPATALPQSLDQITKLNGTFVLEKPLFKSIPRIEADGIDDTEPPTPKRERSESRDFEVDSLEDYGERRRNSSGFSLAGQETNQITSAMAMFKLFLSEHGAEFASEPEFLPYFALPFVENPKEHPTFTKVFEETWIENLRSNLADFLIEHSCGEQAVPELVSMYKTVAKNELKTAGKIEEKKSYKELKRRMHKLKRDHQNLVGVANELASALEKSVQGEAVDLKLTLMKCANIFPDLFPTHLPPHHKKWHSPDRYSVNKRNQVLVVDLDVKKIKHDLNEGSVKAQLLLLQALRWMLTKSKNDDRGEVVRWLCKHDILGLKDGSVKEFLAPVVTPHPIQQAVTRVMNALSSLKEGRKYLESSESAIDLLVDLTKQKELDPVTEDMLIAVLQKLSIRKERADMFVKRNLVEWILEKLEHQPQKIFTLEYSTSLLMNLALTLQPDYWNSCAEKITDVLMSLIGTDRQVRSKALEFVCGSLCCALRNDRVNELCKRRGLNLKLSSSLANYAGDPVMQKQIQALLKIHQRIAKPEEYMNSISTYNDDDLMEDPDDLDPEIDEQDPVTGSPNGSDLLQQQYCHVFNPPRVGRSPARLHTIPASPVAILPAWAQYAQ
ncbi:Armadillo repeat containing 9 [Nesidiocoris tenuis]|uniref:Armadillo repeat containing 9 n=1 Tax=Nesidiocoris tenuis TaxID=355587 RepID=A0ABN7ATW7_9HEMI|nr:Armadillo repeat containing 9 [Nesidiocoris tenuis]